MCWGSGGGSSQTKQQQQVNLEASQQQLQFNEQLMGLFQQQFQNQQNQLNFLKGVMQPVITQAQAGKGFSDEEEAAMRTSATDNLSQQFTNAKQALNQELKTSGSSNIPSGITVGADLSLLTEEAKQQAAAQNTITLASAQQARSNLFNAANVLNGVAAQNNPNPIAGEATAGSSAVAGLSGAQGELQNAITNSSNLSFFGKLATGLGNFIGGSSGQGGLASVLLGG